MTIPENNLETPQISVPRLISRWLEGVLMLFLVVSGTALIYACVRFGQIGIAIAVSDIFFMLVPAIIWVKARRRSFLSECRLSVFSWQTLLGSLLFGSCITLVLLLWIAPWSERLMPNPPELNKIMSNLMRPSLGIQGVFFDFFCYGLVVGFCEEILFRGVLLSGFLRFFKKYFGLQSQKACAIIASAIAFSLFHILPSQLIPTFFAGLALGLAVVLSGSLWAAIIMHILNNGFYAVTQWIGGNWLPVISNPAKVLLTVAALILGTLGVLLLRASHKS